MKAYLVLETWAGRLYFQVEILGETPRKTKVRFLEYCRLPGNRVRQPGDEGLVPKTAIRER